MNKETLTSVTASALFILASIIALLGLAWSMCKEDELFALSFALQFFQILWMLILTLRSDSAIGGQS